MVEVAGLRLEAEAPRGRRNRIGTVLISHLEPAADADQPGNQLDTHAGQGRA
jgi:hypothetical protein